MQTTRNAENFSNQNLFQFLFYCLSNVLIIPNVKLFQPPSCSCKILARSKCVHVLAVMQANGQPITDGYKLPKLSKSTRSKRNGILNRRKRRRHRRNAETEVASNRDSGSDNV